MSALPELDHDPLAENGQYVQLKTLGRGSFGFVVQARNTGTQEVVAIKLLPRAGVRWTRAAAIVPADALLNAFATALAPLAATDVGTVTSTAV